MEVIPSPVPVRHRSGENPARGHVEWRFCPDGMGEEAVPYTVQLLQQGGEHAAVSTSSGTHSHTEKKSEYMPWKQL